MLALEARRLEAAGAELLVLCTNAMHKVADRIESAVAVPLLHLGDVTVRDESRAAYREVVSSQLERGRRGCDPRVRRDRAAGHRR